MTVERINTKEAQIGRLLDIAREKGLTVYEIVAEPKRITLRTQPPLPESVKGEDAADRWLRGRAGAGKADRRA